MQLHSKISKARQCSSFKIRSFFLSNTDDEFYENVMNIGILIFKKSLNFFNPPITIVEIPK